MPTILQLIVFIGRCEDSVVRVQQVVQHDHPKLAPLMKAEPSTRPMHGSEGSFCISLVRPLETLHLLRERQSVILDARVEMANIEFALSSAPGLHLATNKQMNKALAEADKYLTYQSIFKYFQNFVRNIQNGATSPPRANCGSTLVHALPGPRED